MTTKYVKLVTMVVWNVNQEKYVLNVMKCFIYTKIHVMKYQKTVQYGIRILINV